MTSRRSLLQYFGIGTIIVPIIGGEANKSKAAELITVPEVKRVELFRSIPKSFCMSQVESVSIQMKLKDGSFRTISIKRWADVFAPAYPGAPDGGRPEITAGSSFYVEGRLMWHSPAIELGNFGGLGRLE